MYLSSLVASEAAINSDVIGDLAMQDCLITHHFIGRPFKKIEYPVEDWQLLGSLAQHQHKQ